MKLPWSKNNLPVNTRAEENPASLFKSEFNTLLDRFFKDPWAGFELAGAGKFNWAPSIECTETEKEVLIKAEVPGVDPKALEITLHDGLLTISGEKKDTREEQRDGYHHSECVYGSFKRSVRIGTPVNESDVTATYENGVLSVGLKKINPTPTKKINVQVK